MMVFSYSIFILDTHSDFSAPFLYKLTAGDLVCLGDAGFSRKKICGNTDVEFSLPVRIRYARAKNLYDKWKANPNC